MSPSKNAKNEDFKGVLLSLHKNYKIKSFIIKKEI